MGEQVKFEDLVGSTLVAISGGEGDSQLVFETDYGRKFSLHHHQDCCECVSVEEIHGDLKDLIDSPILSAEVVTHHDETPEEVRLKEGFYHGEVYTWTFYKISTLKGSVTIRWYGSSNGWYSTEVDFAEIT